MSATDPGFKPISSTSTDEGVIAAGFNITPQEIQHAEEVRAYVAPFFHGVHTMQLALALRISRKLTYTP